jgi:2-dehydropantoate 2-reductase
VTRLPIGAIRSIPETRLMLVQALQEIDVLARARKIALDDEIVAQTLRTIDGIAADVIPSMQRDIQEGRPSELGSQNGAVVRMGLENGIPTPVHAFIYASLLPQELQARQDLPADKPLS